MDLTEQARTASLSQVETGKQNSSRIPSLDGLRAISIILVMLSHIAGTPNFPIPRFWLTEIIDLGNLGVRVFFVISGYLITSILLKEYAQKGHIDLKGFYLKRFFRIFPAYYIFLLVILLATLLNWIPVTARDWLHAFTYTENYHPRAVWGEGQWYIGHTWSLAVEEQFYILWPVLLVLAGPRRGLKAALGFILIAPFIRLFYNAGNLLWPDLISNELYLFLRGSLHRSFETVGDAIAIGCVLAMSRDFLWQQPLYRRIVQTRYFFIVFLMILGGALLGGHLLEDLTGIEALAFVYGFAGVTVMNVGIMLVIDRYIRHPEHRVGRWLNNRVLAYIGLLSYSIYLWQQPFFNRGAEFALASFPLNLLSVIGLALLSYYLIEKPFLRLRQRVVG